VANHVAGDTGTTSDSIGGVRLAFGQAGSWPRSRGSHVPVFFSDHGHGLSIPFGSFTALSCVFLNCVVCLFSHRVSPQY
jgi:hypothetical protein